MISKMSRRRRNIIKKNNNEIKKIKQDIVQDEIIIITSTNENITYCEFAPIVYQMWKKYCPNSKFILGFISGKEKDSDMALKLKKCCDDFYFFKNHQSIESGVQAKVSRLYMSSLYDNKVTMIVDIDQFVFNFSWLFNKIKPAYNGKFVSIGYNAYINTKDKGKWPMPYTVAPSNVLKRIINRNNIKEYHDWLNSILDLPDPIDNKESLKNNFDNYSDESTLRYMINRYPDQNYIKDIWVKVDREDAIEYNRAHKRIDRWSWYNQFSINKLNNDYYIDCWPLRPFRKNFDKIKPFLQYLDLDLDEDKIFLEDMDTKNRNIEEEIYHRQFEKSQDKCKFLIADLEDGGFGAMVARRKLIFQIAHAFNRTVIIEKNGYLYEECFENYHPYDIGEIKRKYGPVKEFKFSKYQEDKVCYFDFDKYWNSENKKIYQTWSDPRLKGDYLKFSGLILSQFKIKKEYQDYIDNIKKELDFKEKTIGLHVRRGDKGIETGKHQYVLIKSYMREVKLISQKTGINRVFVTSDDPGIFKELKRDYKDFNFFQDENEERYNNANWKMVKNNTNIRKQETMTGIKIIELLASCDYVVGQSNTQFAKLAGSKLSYKKGGNRLVLINYEDNQVVNFGINSKTS